MISFLHRLVILSEAPFLIVHVNAAFSRTAGLEDAILMGKPVSSILVLSERMENIDSNRLQSSQETLSRNTDVHTAGSHEYAAAAGELAAVTEENERCLERLILCCGFGHFHEVNVLSKPSAQHVEGSNTSSISTKSDEQQYITGVTCKMSICPVVSNVSRNLGTDLQHFVSRRLKQQNSNNRVNNNVQKKSPITHYVIQIQMIDDDL